MKNAILRLMLIVVVSASVVLLTVLGLRQLGAGQLYEPLRHPIVSQKPLVIYFDSSQSQTSNYFQSAIETCPKCILQVEARLSLDGTAFVFSQEDLSKSTNGSGFISLNQTDQLKHLKYTDSGLPIMTLRGLLEAYPDNQWLINIHSRDASRLKDFLKSFEGIETKNNIAMGSPFRQILKDAREAKPQWVYTTPPPYLMRIQMYESLAIETMASIWPDMLIFAPKNSTEIPSPGVVSEYLRRKKRVIVDLDEINEDYPIETFGIRTKDLGFAASLFDQ